MIHASISGRVTRYRRIGDKVFLSVQNDSEEIPEIEIITDVCHAECKKVGDVIVERGSLTYTKSGDLAIEVYGD